jgi:hypothetical protein
MNGFIKRKLVAAVVLAGGLSAAGGCYTYHDLVDPCYPDRYNYAARQEVYASFGPQAENGHILDQTVWNYHFEYDEKNRIGTDRLTPGGMEHLAYLARRRPCPDTKIYLQTAQDILYDPAFPEKFAEARSDLDSRRIQAIQKYLTAQTAGRPLAFEVCVHDPAEVGMSAVPMNVSILQMYSTSRGALPLTSGAGAVNVSGGAGAVAGPAR